MLLGLKHSRVWDIRLLSVNPGILRRARRVADVFLDRVGVQSDSGRGAGACGGDDLGARVDDVSGGLSRI